MPHLLIRTTGPSILLLLVVTGAASRPRVEARSGNIYYLDQRGTAVQLTSSGLDSDPSLSCDGKTLIFVRRTPISAGFDEPTELHPRRTQIRLISVSEPKVSRIVFDNIVVVGNRRYTTFSEPHLCADNRHAYFLVRYSAVEFGLIKLDVKSREVRMISGALSWHTICDGHYAGDLVVQKRKPYPVQGVSTLYWLLSEDGQELGYVGQSEHEVEAFLANPNRRVKTVQP